ncbi:MAG: hypothetical protein PHE83_01970 [Opitutaceae bacterium]|nr:hypothetical protein [Opitutaceae bacterium]
MNIRHWLQQRFAGLIDLVLLAGALELTGRALPAARVPGMAELVVLALGLFLLLRETPAESGAWRHFRAQLPALLGVTVGAGVLFHLGFGRPWASLAFAPFWIGAALAQRAVVPVLDRAHSRDWAMRRQQAHDDLLLGEAMVLGIGFYLAHSLYPAFWPHPWLPWTLILLWLAGRRMAGWYRPGPHDVVRLAGSLALLAALWSAGLALHGTIPRAHLTVFLWIAATLAVYRIAVRGTARLPGAVAENLRWLLLALAGFFLLQGFAEFTLHGAPDARWYGTMLADMVAQTRAGVFPVWLGQSIYQFNGAIYPLRVAPAFHYLGALLDALTLRTLGVFALQNLLITAIGLGAIFSAYFSLRTLLPRHRWFAAGLAVFYLACPGVLGIAYNNDLYMSWTTLPWVPLVWLATVRSFRDDGARWPMILLGTALGLCWWGHAPIALWTTLLAGIAQIIRLLIQRPRGRAWLHVVAGAAVFAAVAAYPIGSVLLFPPEASVKADAFQVATAFNMVSFLRQVFPAVLLPLSSDGRVLGDFQLGYALWGLLLFSLWHLWRVRQPAAWILLGASVLVALLLTPIPGLDLKLWNAVPALVRNITGNWAMNRLYLVLAGTVIFGAAAVMAGGVLDHPRRQRWLAVLLTLACAWSLVEAAKFAKGSRDGRRPPETAVDMLRPENILLTSYSYLIFPQPPGTFTHGNADPAMEERLLARDTLAPIATNPAAALATGQEVPAGHFDGYPQPDATELRLSAPLTLEPNRRYLLTCEFLKPEKTIGVFQLTGRSFFREYALPAYGGLKAFGAGGEHANWLSLWTSTPTAEKVTVRFLQAPEAGTPPELVPFAHLRMIAYNPAALPVQVESWVPYRARVRSPAPAWLETPRMFQTGYAATVNGKPATLRKTPDGLVGIAVPAGNSQVELKYRPPTGLAALFWISLAGMAGLVAGTVTIFLERVKLKYGRKSSAGFQSASVEGAGKMPALPDTKTATKKLKPL